MLMLSPARVTVSSCLLALTLAIAAAAQQTEVLGSAAGSVAFIYDGATEACIDSPPGTTLLPLGTGFVSGIPKRGLAPDSPTWTGVKFLITAEHVVRGKSKVVIRLNRDDNVAG